MLTRKGGLTVFGGNPAEHFLMAQLYSALTQLGSPRLVVPDLPSDRYSCTHSNEQDTVCLDLVVIVTNLHASGVANFAPPHRTRRQRRSSVYHESSRTQPRLEGKEVFVCACMCVFNRSACVALRCAALRCVALRCVCVCFSCVCVLAQCGVWCMV